MSTSSKLEALRQRLRSYGRVAVAFSGGLDSSFLLTVAAGVLGSANVLAVTATSAAHTPSEVTDAKRYAKSLRIRHIVLDADLLSVPGFLKNTPNRCYYCKKHLFSQMRDLAKYEGFPTLVDGSTADDLADFRPGLKAKEELGIESPLLEAGLSKPEIRRLARQLGMPQWQQPASPCLASRIPYGSRITEPMLDQVRRAEAILHEQGLQEVRVRHHGTVARIEVPAKAFPTLLKHRKAIATAMKALGFTYVCMDIEGFRSGSLNEGLKA